MVLGLSTCCEITKRGERAQVDRHLENGGEGGIRTPGELLAHTRFPSEFLKPLGHLSTRIVTAKSRVGPPSHGGNKMAERGGFEPPIRLP
jgi:hypothetical protein